MENNEAKENAAARSFVGGALVLGMAGLLVKILGAAFRIPLGNIIGDDGMGYYQTAYPIYNLFLTIATAGIPTAISRMTAERYAIGRPYEAYRVFRISTVLLFATGLVSSCLMFFGAGKIAGLLKEPDAVYCMQAIAVALLFVPLMGSFRGFFQGRQNMRPTAVSQVIEQLFRVGTGLALAVLLLDKGTQFAAAGASFGAAAGGIMGFITIAVIFTFSRKRILKEFENCDKTPLETAGSILKCILLIAVPITIGTSVMPIINALDTVIVKSRLVAIGYDSAVARGLYGQLTGMAQPIINVPQVFTQAVSLSLVPVVATAYRKGNLDFMRSNIALSYRYAMIIAAPCAAGMMVLAKPIMTMFYPMQKESALNAAGCLEILALGTVFLALVHAGTGTLQGIGKQTVPVRNLCVGAVIKAVVTYILTAVPLLNVRGASCGTVAAYLTAAVLNILSVRKHTGTKPGFIITFVKPSVCAAAMGAAVFGVYKLLSNSLGNSISCLISVAAGAVIYALLVLFTGTLTKEELEGMPKGKKIAGLLNKIGVVK